MMKGITVKLPDTTLRRLRQEARASSFAMTYRKFVPVWVSFLLLTFLNAPL